MDEFYLGDGLYASFDGYQIKLRAPRENGDHYVYLDPKTLVNFEAYVARLKQEHDHAASQAKIDAATKRE
jgi:hypothetical protein